MNDSSFQSSCAGVKHAKLFLINMLACGFELCATGAFAYIPPILLEEGLSKSQMTMTLGLGSVLALVFVPKLGKWSDSNHSRLSYVILLSIILLVSLIMLAFVDPLSSIMHWSSRSVTAILVIGTILLDFSTQAAYNPCEAIVSDYSEDKKFQYNYSIYSSMLCLGGCIGYLISSLDWVHFAYFIPHRITEKLQSIVFTIFIVLFLACFFISFISMSPQSVHEKGLKTYVCSPPNDYQKAVSYRKSVFNFGSFSIKKRLTRILLIILYLPLYPFYLIKDIIRLPSVLRKLFITDFLSWCSILCHSLFYTDFVGEVVYKGDPLVNIKVYEEGVRMGSFGLLLHFLAGGLYSAIFLEKLTNKFGSKIGLLSGLISFTIAMLGTVYSYSNIYWLNFYTALSGIGQVTINTISLSLICFYHKHDKIYLHDEQGNRTGIAENLAVLDSAYYLSQIFLSLWTGYLVDYVGSSTMYMVASVFFGFSASISSFFLVFESDNTTTTIKNNALNDIR